MKNEMNNEYFTRAIYLFPVTVKGIGGDKWGYIDAKGKIILPPIYDHGGDFQENGLAIVRMDDHTGVIDSTGYIIVKPKYDTIHPFSEGRATVIDKQGFKVIDESGKEITSKAYSYIGDFKDGRALIKDKDVYGFLNRQGKEVIPPSYEISSDFVEGKAVAKLKNGHFALIGLTGKVLNTYPFYFVGNYGDGLLSFQRKWDRKIGYIDEQGTIIIEAQFSDAQPFMNGRAIVNVSADAKNHYGLINRKGLFLIKPNYNNLFDLGEERFALGKAIDPEKPYVSSKFAVADKDGHVLTGFIYNRITKFKDGIASATNDDSTFMIDKSGKRIEYLPMVSGNGTLEFDKTVIKGEIDFRLLYFDKYGEPIWMQNQVIILDRQQTVDPLWD
jgi:hypothetical protein